jgi:hypothetical protein
MFEARSASKDSLNPLAGAAGFDPRYYYFRMGEYGQP